MDNKAYKDIETYFTAYLSEKKLRKTEERYTILRQIVHLTGHFDTYTLYAIMEENNYHVSKATLYNTLDILVDAGIVIRHQFNTQSVQYELRTLAESHFHLVCTRCGAIKEIKNSHVRQQVNGMKTNRFSVEFILLYLYGVCGKCRYNRKKKIKK